MRRILIPTLAALTLASTGGSAADAPKKPSPVKSTTSPATPAPIASNVGSQGQLAFIDLATGKFVEPSASDAAALARSPEVQNSLNQSSRGLVEEQVPGNRGYRVRLQGRFQSALVATIGPDGKLLVGHPILVAPAPGTGCSPTPKTEGVEK